MSYSITRSPYKYTIIILAAANASIENASTSLFLKEIFSPFRMREKYTKKKTNEIVTVAAFRNSLTRSLIAI